MLRRLVPASLLLALLAAAPARADWQPTPSPEGSGPVHVQGFAISGSSWLAVPRNAVMGTQPRLSTDGGATWKNTTGSSGMPLHPAREREQGVSVGPDGAFYFPAQRTIQRVDPATGQATTVFTVPNAQDALMTAPAWDGEGRMWTATAKNDILQVVRAEGANVAAETYTAAASGFAPFPELASFGGRIYARYGGKVLQVRDGGLQDVSRYGFPVAMIGDRLVMRGGMSPDGGHSFAPDQGPEDGVHGDPNLLVKAGRVLARHATGVYTPTALEVPLTVSAIWRTGDRLVAVSDTSRNEIGGEMQGGAVFAVHQGAIPPLPEASGPMSEESLAGIRAANELRAQAGLPPMAGDARIAQAAESHARYFTMNPYENPHGETPGAPGFTGQSAQERCETAGTTCDAEIMAPGADSAREAILRWLETPFHSDQLNDPEDVWAGFGRVGGVAVMDFRSWEIVSYDEKNGGASSFGTDIRYVRGEQVAPTGYPLGRHPGALSWSGLESPDPLAACAQNGQPITAPIAPTVSARPGLALNKDHPLTAMRVVRVSDGASLAGCRLGYDFLADEPFAPHTTYEGQIDFSTRTPSGELVPHRHAWRFTTGDGAGGTSQRPGGGQNGPGDGDPEDEGTGGGLRDRVRFVTKRVKAGRALLIAVTARRAGRLSVALDPAARGRRTVRRSLPVRAGTRRIKVATRGLRPGAHRVTLRLVLGGRVAARASARVRIVR